MPFPAFPSAYGVKHLVPILLLVMACFFAPPQAAAAHKTLHGPAGSGAFGDYLVVLPNGNFIVADPYYSIPGGAQNVGAVYFYSQAGTLISTLTGSTANDRVGGTLQDVGTLQDGGIILIPGISTSSIVVLSNGNFVINSSHWNGDVGAVTWGSATTGVSGVVSAANSLTGSTAGDQVGLYGVTALTNGNYVVSSPSWNGAIGAATWGSGATGVSGVVSAANSLIGSQAGDGIGQRNNFWLGSNDGSGVIALSNGSYVVCSPNWNQKRGAATWGNGATGISGVVSSSNSLAGSTLNDRVGDGGVLGVGEGNYVVSSPYWSNGLAKDAGAVTWGNGSTGVAGNVSAANSLVGSQTEDGAGSVALQINTFSASQGPPPRRAAITVLSNGNYVAGSPTWNSSTGAATWGSGAAGVTGVVSAGNSLVGSSPGDRVATGPDEGGHVTPLTNGHYVVVSPLWKGAFGAVTWGNGATGTSGIVSASNSLTGSTAGDGVGREGAIALTNGNYVVGSGGWNHYAGAATWCSGTGSTGAAVSVTNSLVGSNYLDQVGGSAIIPLSNGNYVVNSPDWSSRAGAVTWGDGTVGARGAVSFFNSLVGRVATDGIGSGGVIALATGNYVVSSPQWNNDFGAATWGNGNDIVAGVGVTGYVSATNSLVGSVAADRVGSSITALSNGNYVVASPFWNGGAGAATWGSGQTGVTGTVPGTRSLVGSTLFHSGADYIGIGGVIALSNGNYVVSSYQWNGDAGAVTWGNGTTGSSGQVSAVNSLAGSQDGGLRGYLGSPLITPLANGNYVVTSTSRANGTVADAGAVSLGLGATGTTGYLSPANSVLGTAAYGGDSMIFGYQAALDQLVVAHKMDNAVTLFHPGPGSPVITILDPVHGDGTIAGGDSVAFGNTLVGELQSLTFSLTNEGDASLTGLTFAKSGTDQGMYGITAQQATTLQPGDSMSFTLQFAPTSLGVKTALLHILSHESKEPLFELVLTGTGLAGPAPVVAALAATGVSFGGATLHGSVNAAGARSRSSASTTAPPRATAAASLPLNRP